MLLLVALCCAADSCTCLAGFFAADDRGAGANPAAWAGFTGQSFFENHNLPSITHAAVHVWPQNWAIMGASGIAVRSTWLTSMRHAAFGIAMHSSALTYLYAWKRSRAGS